MQSPVLNRPLPKKRGGRSNKNMKSTQLWHIWSKRTNTTQPVVDGQLLTAKKKGKVATAAVAYNSDKLSDQLNMLRWRKTGCSCFLVGKEHRKLWELENKLSFEPVRFLNKLTWWWWQGWKWCWQWWRRRPRRPRQWWRGWWRRFGDRPAARACVHQSVTLPGSAAPDVHRRCRCCCPVLCAFNQSAWTIIDN